MPIYKTNELYVVFPRTVVQDQITRTIVATSDDLNKTTQNRIILDHVMEFEQRLEDATIAIHENHIFSPVFNNEGWPDNLGNLRDPLELGSKFVLPEDVTPLIEYLVTSQIIRPAIRTIKKTEKRFLTTKLLELVIRHMKVDGRTIKFFEELNEQYSLEKLEEILVIVQDNAKKSEPRKLSFRRTFI